MKKGDLSINIIIVAAIALLILVIISVLLFRAGDDVNTGVKSCEAVSGICDIGCDYVASQYEGTWIPNPTRACDDTSEVCCVKL